MTKGQILEAIYDREFLDEEMKTFRLRLNPEKLCEFLAKHLPPHKEGN